MKDLRYLLILLEIVIILFTKSLFAQVENIAGGFNFVEGPVWKDGLELLFSDIPSNRIYLWSPDSGVSVYLNPSANSNGLTFDSQGRLLLAQTGLRRISRLESNGTQTSLADTFNGKRLNSPNDLAVKSDGSIFFTDPPFNVPSNQRELSFSGIYRISPFGELQILDSTLNLPNGICFSPDETKLYVNNSEARIIYVWDVINDTMITNKREFARINPLGYADGMKVDSSGNLFCTAPLGVWVFSSDGIVLDTILVPGQTSNCNWGDEDRRTLYITAVNNIYRYHFPATSVKDHSNLPEGFELNQNYPNPFNPETNIRFRIAISSFVSLKVFNVLGQDVATLVNEDKIAGEYEVNFNTEDNLHSPAIPSGVYFYQLRLEHPPTGSGEVLEKTMKMILIK